MVRRAQEKVKAQGVENVTVTQTDLFDGCLAEGSFNAVLACNVLLYIEDRSAVLARIRALLKPQGTLLLVSDCLGEGLTRERVRKWFEYKTGTVLKRCAGFLYCFCLREILSSSFPP